MFDIPLLAGRLRDAVHWVRATNPELPIGLFGASTGAAAALVAAAGFPEIDALARVSAPTLLVVGERDRDVLELNRQAQARMRCETRLEIVPGATHLFEEPGALERVADLAAAWFVARLRAEPS